MVTAAEKVVVHVVPYQNKLRWQIMMEHLVAMKPQVCTLKCNEGINIKGVHQIGYLIVLDKLWR